MTVLRRASPGKISIRVPKGRCVSQPILIDTLKEKQITISVDVADHASVTVITIIQRSAKPMRIVQQGTVGRHATIHWFNCTLGADVDQRLTSTLSGANAQSTVDWLFLATKNEHQTLCARNVFLGRNGGGEITMKGVAQDKAHVACTGMIDIGPKGMGTQTYLTESVLMLDPTARVDAVPGLEIKTNDVKASHSATVARITPEDLFYFASRGIAEGDARKMFIDGFVGDLAHRLVDTAARERVLEAINN